MEADFEIDHVFIHVSPEAPEAGCLAAFGMEETARFATEGRGIGNAVYCFDNAYLELLWAGDQVRIAAMPIARCNAPARFDWRRSGANPFGVGLRPARPGAPLPFPTWNYAAPVLPADTPMPIAIDSDDPGQPVLFLMPIACRPDSWTGEGAGRRQQGAGLAEIRHVHLDHPAKHPPGPALCAMERQGVLSLGRAEGFGMTLTFSRTDGGPDARLCLPAFTWS